MGVREGAVLLEDRSKYYRVPLKLYKDGDILETDIYLNYQGNFLLYRPKKSKWTQVDTQKLTEFGAKELYIRCHSDQEHFKFLESNLTRVLNSQQSTVKEKAVVLHQVATNIAEGMFTNPNSSEAFAQSKHVVKHTMDLIAKDSQAFFDMISLSSHDVYTYTHCVNVMTFTIGLLNALGFTDKKILEESAIGAFLHDIGKSRVPIDVLNKPAPLTPEEWKVVKRHPEFGLDILHNRPVPARSKEIIVQHHEKINGIGYPYGLRGNQIQMASQVVAICDAYDAMTSNRCYQRAKTPFEAFLIITQEMKGHFPSRVVETFIQLLNIQRKNLARPK